jgi:hypothetical protein
MELAELEEPELLSGASVLTALNPFAWVTRNRPTTAAAMTPKITPGFTFETVDSLLEESRGLAFLPFAFAAPCFGVYFWKTGSSCLVSQCLHSKASALISSAHATQLFVSALLTWPPNRTF